MALPRLDRTHTALLVVDLQERLLPHMHNAADLTIQAGKLIDGAKILGLPILVTEQYRKGLGATVPEVAARLGDTPRFEKLKFSACIDPVRQALASRPIRNVILCGIEAHVCVLQTALDLMDTGFLVALAIDAIGSRRRTDQDAAVARMTQAGVLPTTVESALLEMLREAGTPEFKAMLDVIK
jgi:nicotinamidase-related amidase